MYHNIEDVKIFNLCSPSVVIKSRPAFSEIDGSNFICQCSLHYKLSIYKKLHVFIFIKSRSVKKMLFKNINRGKCNTCLLCNLIAHFHYCKNIYEINTYLRALMRHKSKFDKLWSTFRGLNFNIKGGREKKTF